MVQETEKRKISNRAIAGSVLSGAAVIGGVHQHLAANRALGKIEAEEFHGGLASTDIKGRRKVMNAIFAAAPTESKIGILAAGQPKKIASIKAGIELLPVAEREAELKLLKGLEQPGKYFNRNLRSKAWLIGGGLLGGAVAARQYMHHRARSANKS